MDLDDLAAQCAVYGMEFSEFYNDTPEHELRLYALNLLNKNPDLYLDHDKIKSIAEWERPLSKNTA